MNGGLRTALIGAALLAAGVAAGVYAGRWSAAGDEPREKAAEAHETPAGEEEKAPAAVRTEPVVEEVIHPMVEAIGVALVPPAAVSVVSWPAEVAVLRVVVAPGQRVERGEPLVRVSLTRDAELQLSLAQQVAEATTRALAAAQARVDRGLATRQELITAQPAADEARQRYERLKAAVPPDDGMVRAAEAGVVQAVRVQAGAVAAPNSAILEIAESDTVVAQLGAEPADAASIAAGQPVVIAPVDERDASRYEGAVLLVAPSVDSATRLVGITVQFAGAARPRPGTALRGTVRLPEARALTVSRAAVVPDGDDRVVFAVRDGKAVRTPIGVGRRIGDRIEVTSGCAAGDRVIVLGQSQLTDGAAVKQEGAVEGR